MKSHILNDKGFTLIEIIMVLAIVTVLTSIAIPSFNAFRIRAWNSASSSDLKNIKTTEEAIFTGWMSYGRHESGVNLLSVTGAAGVLADVIGPLPAATNKSLGLSIAAIIDSDNNGTRDTPFAIGVPLSSNVFFHCETNSNLSAYRCLTQHRLSNRAFSSNSVTYGMCYSENDSWAENKSEASAEETVEPSMDISCTNETSSGSPIASWLIL